MRALVVGHAGAARRIGRDGAEVLVQARHDDQAAAEEAEDDFGFTRGEREVSDV